MNFPEKLAALSQRVPSIIDSLHTEEATKNALVMPFIAALGYDVFDPTEVIPEFIADIGVKKGEKVDYAIMQGGEMIMLLECKKAGTSLCNANMSQLFRYFTVTHARIGVLTNGVQYWFFSDLEAPNRMDTRPFLELDLLNLRDSHVAEVKKLGRESFDLEQMLEAANELKFTREIKKVLHQQFENPHDEFVRFFFSQANPDGRFIASVREQFKVFVHKAIHQYLNEQVNNRLRNALQREEMGIGSSEEKRVEEPEVAEVLEEDDGVETTPEEIEGYHIVRAIVREVVPADRIAHRDTKSYMGILLDNNNRKPICRLRFNWSQKYLGLFDEEKNEVKVPLESLDDIYKHSEKLKSTAQSYNA